MTDTFHPDDWILPPGDTVADVRQARGWSAQAFADHAGISRAHAERLIRGDAPIDESTAAMLARALGSTRRFWLTREAHYRARIRRLQSAGQAEQEVDLAASG